MIVCDLFSWVYVGHRLMPWELLTYFGLFSVICFWTKTIYCVYTLFYFFNSYFTFSRFPETLCMRFYISLQFALWSFLRTWSIIPCCHCLIHNDMLIPCHTINLVHTYNISLLGWFYIINSHCSSLLIIYIFFFFCIIACAVNLVLFTYNTEMMMMFS